MRLIDPKPIPEVTMSYQAHPTAIIDPGAIIGDQTRIWHWVHICGRNVEIGEKCSFGQNVYVGNDVKIGNGVKVQNNVSIYDRVVLEDEVFCGPSMVFTNVINPRSHIERKHEYKTTLVKKGASIGANATIVCGNTIGSFAFIAAGAVITKDVPDYALMAGVPARWMDWSCSCGERLYCESKNFSGNLRCRACKLEYAVKDHTCVPVKGVK